MASDAEFEIVSTERARRDRLETVGEWVDMLLLPEGQTIAALPPEAVLKRLREVAEHAPVRPRGLVRGAIARVWRARRPIQNAVRAGQVALVVGRLACFAIAVSSLTPGGIKI